MRQPCLRIYQGNFISRLFMNNLPGKTPSLDLLINAREKMLLFFKHHVKKSGAKKWVLWILCCPRSQTSRSKKAYKNIQPHLSLSRHFFVFVRVSELRLLVEKFLVKGITKRHFYCIDRNSKLIDSMTMFL